MKKYVTLFISLLCVFFILGSCNERDEIKYDSGIYDLKYTWAENENYGGIYDEDVIPNAECAIEVAKAIFDSMNKSSERNDHTVFSVFYDEEDEFWVVSFGKLKDENGYLILGGDCSIVIQKSDGKVLRIEFGE